MSTITVSESQFPNYQYAGSTARVRIYYLQSFRSSENINIIGAAIGGAGWFLDLACTVDDSDILHVPSFTLYSTEDSNNPSARFVAVVYSQNGARRETIMGGDGGWVVPASPTSTTKALLEIAQGRGIVNPPASYITRIATQALIDAAIGLLRFATSVIAGWVRLSVPAADVDDPIAVGDNDPRLDQFIASRYTAAVQTVPAPTTAPTVSTPTVTLGTFGTQPGNAAFTDAHRYEVAITYNGRTGESTIGPSASFTATEGQGLAVAPNAPSSTLAASANIYIKDLDGANTWKRAADASGVVENNNCGFGDNDSAIGGMAVKYDAAGAAPPGVSTATKPDGVTALGETPSIAPTLTKLTSILSTIGPVFYSYSWLTENGETALSPFSSGVTAPSGTIGAWMPLYIPSTPPIGAVAIRVYAGLAATEAAMRLQVEGEIDQVRFPMHSFNGSGAVHVTATPTSTIPRILLAYTAALTAGGGEVVSPSEIETTTIPLIFGARVAGVFKSGVRLSGRGGNNTSSTAYGLTKINYVGSRSGVTAVVLAAGSLAIENIEFGDPNNRVKHGIGLAGFDSSAGYNGKLSDVTIRANAPGGIGIVGKTNQCGSGSHNTSDGLFERVTVYAESWGVDLSAGQNVFQQFKHLQCTIANSASRANSGSVRIATQNNSFDGVEQAGSGHYKYYITNEYLDDFATSFASARIDDSYDESAERKVFCYTSPLDINGSGPTFGAVYVNNQTGGQIYGFLLDNATRGSVDLVNKLGSDAYNYSNSATGNIETGRSPGGAGNPLPNWGSRTSTAYSTPLRTLCNGAQGFRNAGGNLSTIGTNAAGDVVVTPFSGIASSPQLKSTIAIGTPPLVVTSTTKVTNLNADKLDGQDFADPGPIGGTTPAAGTFTTLNASGAITFGTTNGDAAIDVAGAAAGGIAPEGRLFLRARNNGTTQQVAISLSTNGATSAATVYAPTGTFAGLKVGANTVPAAALDVVGSALATGSIKSSGTAGIGYATGAGGTVTQATSKATAVTLDKITGLITLNAAALAAATIVSFVLTNSAISATDQIIVTHESGGTLGAYTVNGRATGAGTGAIDLRNNTAGSLSEAVVLRFTIIKSVSA